MRGSNTVNQIAEEMRAVLEGEEIEHYGMPRRSGRYPWGSGDEPYQHSRDWLARYDEMKKSGMSESQIAKELGYLNHKGQPSVSRLRAAKANEKNIRDIYRIDTAKSLREDGLNTSEIGRKMGVNESTVRGWFDAEYEARARAAMNTAMFIKEQVDKKGMVDIGTGVELELGISKEKLNQALLMVEEEGYPIHGGGVPQLLTPGQQTNQRVICVPGTKANAIYEYDKVHPLNEDKYVSHDGGETFVKKFTYPTSLDSKRLMIRYKDDVDTDGATGDDKDGLVELRRGCKDLSLEGSRYSQVRIMVDGTHYIKGMAVYSDDMPDGVDVIFNTNKSRNKSLYEVLKPIKEDPDNPFGSAIKDADQGGQYWYDDNGTKKLGLINKRADEGDWSDWSNALPSQFLGKQSLVLAKQQLNLAKADRLDEYERICELNNPTLKKHFLSDFADKCDAAAVDLKAAALPGQKYHVMIPINTLKDNEVYAPNYENGSKLALIRYPHGGTFEIPILTVNNKNPLAKKVIGTDSGDAIGINKKNADRLSGADYDGDTAMCIPCNKIKITSKEPLKGLKDFDPKMEYPERPGMQYLSKKGTQQQMGIISNLITDMTLDGGATDAELAAAVRHSMVVIDAHKHKLDYKRSEVNNNIAALKRKYQPKYDADGNEIEGKGGGAATILSRAKGQASVDKRQGSPYTNIKGKKGYDPTRPEGALVYKTADDLYKPVKTTNKKTGIITLTTDTGEKIKYNPKDAASRDKYQPIKVIDNETGEISYKNRAGTITYKTKKRTQPSTKMAETDDAYTLVSKSKHPMEMLYADYANSMKALANKARLEAYNTKEIESSASAKATYSEEVISLRNKLDAALSNAPRNREATRRMNAAVKAAQEANPDMEKEDIKKTASRAIKRAREEVSSASRKERNIQITDREWEAIQAGAVPKTWLRNVIANTDIDKLKERAMPKATTTLTATQINRLKSLAASGYTLDEIAKKMGKSTSTVSKYLKGAK